MSKASDLRSRSLKRKRHPAAHSNVGPVGTKTNLKPIDAGTSIRSTSLPPGTIDRAGQLLASAMRPSHGHGDPIEIPQEDVNEIVAPGKSSTLLIGGIWGQVQPGTVWTGSDGKRLILSAISTDVVYTTGGKFYYQTAKGFIGDITTTPFRDAAVRLQPIARITEIELQLVLGIIAGSSGIGFVMVVGTEAARWLVIHRPDIIKINDQIAKFFQAREIVKTCAPTMYEFLFNQVLKIYKEKLSQAITPEVIAFFAGVLLGHFGKDYLEGHPLTPLRIIWIVCTAIVARTIMDILPDAKKLAAEEIEDPDRLLQRARSGQITITKQQYEQMTREVAAHKSEMKKAYQLLDEAFNG